MFKNIVKVALKVLMRRKFFTIISLSGITFTLTVLIIAAAFAERMLSPARPGSKYDRSMFINRIDLWSEDMRIGSGPGYRFLEKYAKSMTTPEEVSIQTKGITVSSYVGDHRIDLKMKHTDAEFWDILEYDFVEGHPYDSQAVAQADYVAVITDFTRNQVFGNRSVLGEMLETTEGNYRVVGVIHKEDIPAMEAAADCFVPITTEPTVKISEALWGDYLAIVLADSKGSFPLIKEEWERSLEQARTDYAGEFSKIESHIRTSDELITAKLFDDESNTPIIAVVGMIIGSMLLFMLFPTINLVNLNITRIMERASEIGVRKAFGASRSALVGQFLIENIILTLIGGVAAWILSWLLLSLATGSSLVPFGKFEPDFVFFLYTLLICLVFGLISGVYPAYRMAKMKPVEALRGVES
ncbi:MAG TPA: FtsX-like permease family protein [candidate division Zixibacteria bacterium]|nr:FtsX-like permease family protein [candidate division Zixibacteria bacterium]